MDEEIKKDLVSFNASPYEIVINGEERVGGKIEFSMKINDAERDPLSSEEYCSILMEGKLVTKYYETDIRSLETRRYYIDGIEVFKEGVVFTAVRIAVPELHIQPHRPILRERQVLRKLVGGSVVLQIKRRKARFRT